MNRNPSESRQANKRFKFNPEPSQAAGSVLPSQLVPAMSPSINLNQNRMNIGSLTTNPFGSKPANKQVIVNRRETKVFGVAKDDEV